MSTTRTVTAEPTVGTLARKEIVRYARHPIFLAGLALLVVSIFMQPEGTFSTALEGLAPAAVLGLFGLVVMASLTRSSDRAAEAAGTVSTSQRARTLALASAVVVPLVCALVWFAFTIVGYHQHPPTPETVPFGPVTDTFIYATIFAQGVMAAVGGPILGLVIGRWVPRRGAAPVAVVLMVLVTIVMQGIFEFSRFWREVWPWTHFYGPMGIDGDPNRALVLTGSPYLYVGYLAALCAIGVLVAMLRDEEADRRGLLRVLSIVGLVAVLLLVLSITGGFDDTLVNPLPSGIE